MRKVILLMHTSLDGFVAGPEGEMDWISMDEAIFEDAIGLANSADAALYGRVTYQMMEGYWPGVLTNPSSTKNQLHHAQWVEDVKKVVFSTTLEGVEWNNTQLIKENVAEEVSGLKAQPGDGILLIFGSPRLTHSFTEMGLIDEFYLFVNPMVLGDGIPLFRNTGSHIGLKLLETKTFDNGVVKLRYDRAA
jgi:dihydrofolate reductase